MTWTSDGVIKVNAITNPTSPLVLLNFNPHQLQPARPQSALPSEIWRGVTGDGAFSVVAPCLWKSRRGLPDVLTQCNHMGGPCGDEHDSYSCEPPALMKVSCTF